MMQALMFFSFANCNAANIPEGPAPIISTSYFIPTSGNTKRISAYRVCGYGPRKLWFVLGMFRHNDA